MPPVKIADAPFDKANADIIIRTADDVDFHVHRIILILASPFFEDMFSLPQGPSTSTLELPVIDVSEPSHTWDALLRICYPCTDPVLEDLGDITTLLEAAAKYQVAHVETTAKLAFIVLAAKQYRVQ